jgi:predicted dehydrogenase
MSGISINRLAIDDVEPLRTEVLAFVDSIRTDTEPPITAEDGRRAVALAVGVLERIQAHRDRLNV